jgi:hypothetical protein
MLCDIGDDGNGIKSEVVAIHARKSTKKHLKEIEKVGAS